MAHVWLASLRVDLNPVAWLVTKEEIEPVDPDNLDAAKADKKDLRSTCVAGFPAYTECILSQGIEAGCGCRWQTPAVQADLS